MHQESSPSVGDLRRVTVFFVAADRNPISMNMLDMCVETVLRGECRLARRARKRVHNFNNSRIAILSMRITKESGLEGFFSIWSVDASIEPAGGWITTTTTYSAYGHCVADNLILIDVELRKF